MTSRENLRAHQLVTVVMHGNVPDLDLAQEVRDEHEDLVEVLQEAACHLRQYRAYAEEMRSIGRGMEPSSPFTPEYLDGMISRLIRRVTS